MRKTIFTLSVVLLLTLWMAACDQQSQTTANKAVEDVEVAASDAVEATAEKANEAMDKVEAVVSDAADAMNKSAGTGEYTIDIEGAHAFINAKFLHLGYSVLWATFRDFNGSFFYDADNIENSRISLTIDTNSLFSNHEKRDEHIRSADYLDTAQYPTATFTSTSIASTGGDGLSVTGDLTLHGVTKSITFDARRIAEGADPWGGYRAGFEGRYTLNAAEFGMEKFRPSTIEMELFIEGIKNKDA